MPRRLPSDHEPRGPAPRALLALTATARADEEVAISAGEVEHGADVLRIESDVAGQVRFETFDGTYGTCAGIHDAIEIHNTAGTLLATADGGGIGTCARATVTLDAGPYFVRIHDADNDAVIPAYSLEIEPLWRLRAGGIETTRAGGSEARRRRQAWTAGSSAMASGMKSHSKRRLRRRALTRLRRRALFFGPSLRSWPHSHGRPATGAGVQPSGSGPN